MELRVSDFCFDHWVLEMCTCRRRLWGSRVDSPRRLQHMKVHKAQYSSCLPCALGWHVMEGMYSREHGRKTLHAQHEISTAGNKITSRHC